MAKNDKERFFSRKDFDIALFASVFSGIYNVYYESGDDGPAYRDMVAMGDRLLQDKSVAPLNVAFAEYRQDIVTSDREAAAFAAAYAIYEKRYGQAA